MWVHVGGGGVGGGGGGGGGGGKGATAVCDASTKLPKYSMQIF